MAGLICQHEVMNKSGVGVVVSAVMGASRTIRSGPCKVVLVPYSFLTPRILLSLLGIVELLPEMHGDIGLLFADLIYVQTVLI